MAIIYFGLFGVALAWGAWLLATRDVQGGRHFIGGAIVVTATVAILVGFVVRSGRRRTPAS